jgi:hypothetical protein
MDWTETAEETTETSLPPVHAGLAQCTSGVRDWISTEERITWRLENCTYAGQRGQASTARLQCTASEQLALNQVHNPTDCTNRYKSPFHLSGFVLLSHGLGDMMHAKR